MRIGKERYVKLEETEDKMEFMIKHLGNYTFLANGSFVVTGLSPEVKADIFAFPFPALVYGYILGFSGDSNLLISDITSLEFAIPKK